MRKLTKLMVGAIFIAGMTVFGAAGPLGELTDFTKWKAGQGTKIEKSVEYKTTGEACAKITIATGNKYPGILLENQGVFNLSNATTLTFDCFNPGEKITFRLKIKSPGKQYSKSFIIPAQKSTIKISLADAKIDMSAVKYIKLWTKKPKKEVVLFIDNLVFE